MIRVVKEGSLFDKPYDVIVCPVNLVGVMGAGLAKEFSNASWLPNIPI